jgi:peptide N-acetyl-beta-D-glucosaminyl asparaginase amidase A
MTQSRLFRRTALFLTSLCWFLAVPGIAQVVSSPSLALTLGSPNVATADPPLARPSTTPCAVQLFSNFTFADFSPKPFTYTPPASCPGPWAKVVLEADFSCTAGRQFDRTAEIAIGHVNVYFGTTQEPSATVSPSWHVERDLTDYSPLFQNSQAGDVNLGNLVNGTFTGILHGSARLLFYPLPSGEQAPRTADVVLPLSNGPGGAASLETGANVLAPTFSLPTNIEGAFLDVIAQSQGPDEFWYVCVPDDVADELFSCGGTAFRETEVTIDGQPAGVAPVYPWIFTGGIDPLLWRPTPSVETLNFQPYRLDLTPFAGVLSDGQPHQVGVSVFNANHRFTVAGSLLLYLDHGATQVTGGVTLNTLAAAPQPEIEENLATAEDGTITATVTTKSERKLVLAGFVDTSHGRVETVIRQKIAFSNVQDFINGATVFRQTLGQNTEISSETEKANGRSSSHTSTQLSFPLNLDFLFVVNDDGTFAQTTTIDQRRDSDEATVGGGFPTRSETSNAVNTTDTLLFNSAGAVTGFRDRNSSQTYTAQTFGGSCYSRSITTASGLLTSVTDRQACGGHGPH